MKNKIISFGNLILILVIIVSMVIPVVGITSCGPSKGLVSGLTLSSNYVAPTGSVAEKPGFIEDNEQSIQTKVNVDDFVLIGNSQLESGNYQEAITAYDQAIKSDPTNSMAWNGKMSALLYLDKYEDVISLFTEAKKSMPDDFGIWINKGRAEFYLNEFAKARQSADEALKISPDNLDALILKADGLAIQAKPGAYEITDTVLTLDPDNSDIWFARGHALYSKWALEGDLIEEERKNLVVYLEKDLKFHPDRECSKKLLGTSYEWSGRELYNEGKYEEAIVQYDKGLQIYPDDPYIWGDKVYPLVKLSRYEEALEACEKALELDSDDETFWYFKGYILYSLNRYEEALKPINMAISLGHEKAEALKEEILGKLTEVSHSSNNSLSSDKPLESLEKDSSSKENTKSAKDYLNEMFTAYENDDMVKALEISIEAIELYPDNDDLWSNKGAGLNNLERYEEAIEAADKAISLDKSNSHAWFVKGYALEKLGKYDDAEIYYEKSLELEPNNEDYLEGLDRLRELM